MVLMKMEDRYGTDEDGRLQTFYCEVVEKSVQDKICYHDSLRGN